MSVELESVVQLYDDGVNYGKIGVSKRIDNYTISEILDFLYAGVVTKQLKNYIQPVTAIWKDSCKAPIKIGDAGYNVLASEGEGTPTESLYGRVIWCYAPVYGANLLNTQTLSLSDTGTYIITNADTKNFVVKVNQTRAYDWENDDQQASSFSDTGKAMDFTVSFYYQDNGATNFTPTGTDTHRHELTSIAPFMIVPVGDSYILVNALTFKTIGGGNGGSMFNPPAGLQYNYLTDINGNKFSFAPICNPTAPTTKSWYAYGMDFTAINSENEPYSLYFFFNESNRQSLWRYVPNTLEELNNFTIRGGVYIYTDKLYKPIISNGVISGFTDNTDTPSEIDTYTYGGGNSHTVPPSPPSPTPSDNNDIETDMPLAYIGGTGGFVQFIKINSAGLASADDISAALSRFDITTIGKDLLRNFVSYKCFAVLSIDPDDTVTRQIKVDGHGLTDENNNPLQGQIIGSVLPIDFTIGTPTKYYEDFRDYAPYTKIEAYVPFCGWFTLPSWCIGHEVTGTMFTDLYNGTVKAVIKASQTVVAEIGGCCAYDIPFVADATGAKAGAVISSALSTAAATAAAVTMPNVATGIAAATSAANTICAVNNNDTTLKGVLGDGSNLNGLLHTYLKVTRPQSPTHGKDIPSSYKHEFGVPCFKEITLASGQGFTQVNDANITGTMTATEKQMIIDGFRHGLIL